ncbi:MAG TPA: aminopeptidase, partial [Thermoanaerobaculia bacterium]|nr:aminopeptidase [Thermoanaerobaculia bacterium]
MKRLTAALALLLAAAAHAQCDLDKILPQLDGNRMKATVEKLVSFGTRHSLSPKNAEARAWILDEMNKIAAASGGRMTVRLQSSTHSGPRTNNQPVEFVNVVATIKGTSDPDRIYIATGHYDSVNGDQKDT